MSNEKETTLERFSENLRQTVISRMEQADEGSFYEEDLTGVLLEYLQDAGDVEEAQVCSFRGTGPRGGILQMSAYGLSENEESLDLFITISDQATPPTTLGASEVKKYFDRLSRLFNEARAGVYQKLEESSPAYDAFHTIWRVLCKEKTLLQVRLVLLTDSVASAPPPPDQDRDSVRFNFDIWDIERFYRLITSGAQREKIAINFEETLGEVIPCLVQPTSNPDYSAYLAIFPGKALLELYGRYGSRLLERNVRSFLQVRGSVNQGMRKTILQEPHMFLAFNNGLAVTAEEVELAPLAGGGQGIRSIRDLQIVNGGQTTASIFHAAKRDRADVEKLFVQVKLTVLRDPERMDEVIPLISRYANSQNKIQAADLVANDAYHRSIEELSRTIWAPAPEGTMRQTHWFYERARGQYQDEIAQARTPAKVKSFQNENPKIQLFTKTDLAKYILAAEMLPHIVSRGNQKCLVYFMDKGYLEAHREREGELNADYFERVVARVILFRTAETLVRKERDRFPAYRANLVAYAVARLVHETDGHIDLGRIWREQTVPKDLQVALLDLAQNVWSFITTENRGGNVTEFCKKHNSWEHFLRTNVYTDGGFGRFKVSPAARAQRGAGVGKAYAAQEKINHVRGIDASAWLSLAEWGRRTGQLTGLECTIAVEMATRTAGGEPINLRRAETAEKILSRAKAAGYQGLSA